MNLTTVTKLWLSSDCWEEGSHKPEDDCVDVAVTVADGTRWVATFCSFQHVQTLRSRWARSGECLSGRYVWMTNMILVVDTSRQTIEHVIQDLLASGEFKRALAQLERESEVAYDETSD